MPRPKRRIDSGLSSGVTDQRGAARRLGCSERCVRMLESRGVLRRVSGAGNSFGGGLSRGSWYMVSRLDELRKYREMHGRYPWDEDDRFEMEAL